MKIKRMTAEQFAVCNGSSKSASALAAKSVLVDGANVQQAMASYQVSLVALQMKLSRIRKAFKTVCEAGPWPVHD